MLIEMACAMTVTAVVFELILVARFRFLLELFERNILVAIVFSILLSWTLGEVFGATGLVVMLSALASTLLTAVVYRTNALELLEPVIHMAERMVVPRR